MRRLSVIAAAMLAVAVVLASCGIPDDNDPQALATDEIPPVLRGTTPASVAATVASGRGERIWLIESDPGADESHLSPLEWVFQDPDEEKMVRQLLESRDLPESLSNNVPAETQLLDIEYDGDLAILTLSEEFGTIQSDTQAKAVAQLVYTVTELGRIERVRFRVADELIDVNTSSGELKRTVTRDDFTEFAPIDTN